MNQQPVDYTRSFRDARKIMGFVHTSAYVPSNRSAEFSLFVDRLKAERMIEICEKSLPTSGDRQTLANRNMMDLPSVEEVKALMERYPNQPAIKRQAQELIGKLETANSALNVSRMAQEHDEIVQWMSWAVANNHLANVIWREIVNAVTGLEVKKDGL